MSRDINGHTTVFGVIGDPISHSFSPQIHRYFADLYNLNMAYLPFHVKDSNVPAAICGAHALGIRGLNVTVPHKKSVMPHLSHIDPMAQQIGTVNTLMWGKEGYAGYNTDYIGIQRTLEDFDISFKNNTVAVLGAGGTAFAACVAAATQGASRIIIVNRTKENAIFLASHVNTYYNVPVDIFVPEEFSEAFFKATEKHNIRPSIVIQTTTIGFDKTKDESPIPGSCSYMDFFAGVQLAFDIIYTPWETIFLQQAKEAGVPKVTNGFPMLVYQAAAAFDLWQNTEIVENGDMESHIKTLAKML